MKIIGLCGYKRSGKDSAAQALTRVGYVQMCFATPIKLMLGALFSYAGTNEMLVSDVLDGDLKDALLVTLQEHSARYAMQSLGTEWGRDLIGQDMWVDILFARAQKKGYSKVVISDVRFDNEVVALRKHGGKLIRIDRGLSPDGHASEQIEHIIPDRIVTNFGTLAQLEDSIRTVEETLWKQSS